MTNSSSSSFLIVGLNDYDDRDLIFELSKAEGVDQFEMSYGSDHRRVISFYGGYCDGPDDFDGSFDDYYGPSYAGIPIEDLMETMTLPQMRQHFSDLVKKEFGIDIPTSRVKLIYGETGDG